MSKSVFIVEDNRLNMKLFDYILQAHGYDTIQSLDGQDAVALTEETGPDLILMDIQLPKFWGLEITKMITAEDAPKDIPIIAPTAFAMQGDEEEILKGGCDGYIAKPISVPDFLQTVEKFLN